MKFYIIIILSNISICIVITVLTVDYEEDEWPERLGEPKKPSSASGTMVNGSATEVGALKRFAERKRTDCIFYKMGAMLAGVGAGFDIRISNTSAIHPQLQTHAQRERGVVQNPVVSSNRDAYYAAVKDSFLQADINREDYEVVSPSGTSIHLTYHGKGNKYRPNVNFDIPLMFTETLDSVDYNGKTPSSDTRTTPSLDRQTPSVSGTSISAGSSSPVVTDESINLALISLSPSQDRAFVQRQHSETSSVFETPRTTPKTPQRQGVKFEESVSDSASSSIGHRRTPSNSSASSYPLDVSRSPCYDLDTNKLPPTPTIRPPPKLTKSGAHTNGCSGSSNSLQAEQRPIERPITLSFRPRPRPQQTGILKKSSPTHVSSGSSPRANHNNSTPPDTVSSCGDDASSYVSAHSASTPEMNDALQHTLLDLDAIGQREDPTKPLPAKHDVQPLSISALEKEFLL